ncbi:MAG TPA: RES family NAD+ phosphorylase [Rhizomicrobium sp.]|nr:RES family NAD+ phosphorylase [Rhizomicrobium sp.]
MAEFSTGAIKSGAHPFKAEAWRVVEAQHRISTMKLADTPEEQALLEQLIESTKPPVPEDARGLHYLLYTPFRYAPYPKGSRFRRAGLGEGVFYAASVVDVAVAETVFHRLLFFAESPGLPFPRNPGEFTAFSVRLAARRAVDLTRPPFTSDARVWMHVQNYAPCQSFADSCREAGVETIVYAAVRDPDHRPAYAVLTPRAFAAPKPVRYQSWHIRIGPEGGFAGCEAPKRGLSFPLEIFCADPRLAILRGAKR